MCCNLVSDKHLVSSAVCSEIWKCNSSALLPRTVEHQHTALHVQAMHAHKHEWRCSSTNSLPLHHMEESSQLHRLATSLPGKESPVPIIRVSPRAILGIFEHKNLPSLREAKPWMIRLISQSLYWALPFPNQNGIHQWILVINLPLSFQLTFLCVLHTNKGRQTYGYTE
jgi:hypothetical protein